VAKRERGRIRSAARTDPQSQAAPAAVADGQGPPSLTRVWTFRLILVALPFLLLGLVETGLRLGGFGRDLEPLFIPAPNQPAYLQANPRAVTRLFLDPAQAPSVSIETAYFVAAKPEGTFRVFVQGESSAAGFPYGLGASLAGILDQRLERAFPSREIEVISTAMAAVNSYALLDFADQIIAQRPDAIVIYAGHNEYLGILGVGSSFRFGNGGGATRLFLALRELRLFQALDRLYRHLRPAPVPASAPASGDSLMARVAGERSIALGSPLYEAGLQQFRRNLGTLLAKYRAAGIPVFVGTLLSNERDQPPLAKLGGDTGDTAGAAQTAFDAARDAEDAGHFDAAREGYAWARDLDPLRFRAPSDFNRVVAEQAAREGARLVDVRAAFVAASREGLVGRTLLLEHVHPNLEGYFLLADAFHDALLAAGLPGTPEVVVDDARARREIPASEIDHWLGDFKVRKITAGWPFRMPPDELVLPSPATEGERLAQEVFHSRLDWASAQDRLRRYQQAQGDSEGYARGSAILADAFPFVAGIQYETAAALIAVQRPADALRYASRAVALDGTIVDPLLVQAHALVLLGRRDEARRALERVLVLEPGNATARGVLRQLDAPVP
jgi:tetratricopeptide (TPR) repeat protein